MKKLLILLLSILLALSIIGCNETYAEKAEVTEQKETNVEQVEQDHDYGAKSAVEKEAWTLEEMFEYAIEDEYLARQEYESIMEEYGEQKPFSNIIKAEENHIELLKELYKTYGFEMPQDHAIEYVVLPDSVEQAMEIGVQAEIDNIAMYNKFLEQDLPADVREVFEELRDGSENHLEAFKKGPRGNGKNS